MVLLFYSSVSKVAETGGGLGNEFSVIHCKLAACACVWQHSQNVNLLNSLQIVI